MYTLHFHTMQRRKSRHCGTALIAITTWFACCTVGHCGTGTVEGWLGNLDTIWIHFPVWISPEPQQIIFLSNSNCLHFLSDNAGDQIHCRSILPKNLQFWSCGWLGQAQNYRECRNRLVALNGNWSVTVTPRRQLALRTCNKQILYRENSQILISISQHFINHGFRCHSGLAKVQGTHFLRKANLPKNIINVTIFPDC